MRKSMMEWPGVRVAGVLSGLLLIPFIQASAGLSGVSDWLGWWVFLFFFLAPVWGVSIAFGGPERKTFSEAFSGSLMYRIALGLSMVSLVPFGFMLPFVSTQGQWIGWWAALYVFNGIVWLQLHGMACQEAGQK